MKFRLTVAAVLFSISCFSQAEWNPYIGLHVSTDAGAYYTGPSAQIGVNFQFNNKLALSTYLHYFPKDIHYKYDDGTYENGKYHSAIYAMLLERNFYGTKNRGFALAGGVAVQYTSEYYTSSWFDEHYHRVILVAAIRFGYTFPIGKQSLAIELNGVGPHFSKSGTEPYVVRTTEVLTQLSFGTRIIW
jgi:hypothetical protein